MFPIADENLPGRGLPWVTIGLIAANVAVFLLLQAASADNAFTYGWSSVPFEITHGVDLTQAVPVLIDGQQYLIPQAPGPDPIYLTLISSMFMHGSWLHLGGNMLFLWIFGDNVEHRAGPILFLLAYLGTGLVGSLAQVLAASDAYIPSLGASGAISGVLGAYIVLFPRNRVTAFVFRFFMQVPAIVAIGMWIALQLLSSLADPLGAGGVAYLAHIGGFAAGLVAGLLLRALPDRGPGSPVATRS
ncbi:MAG: rhomboid family intramembrane serine protease [Candidatus Limnocylindria bacterium]